tara:strand:- start:2403 stop:2990 length:588 start_codon:yes stop_codon:yes gene_type:complete
MNWWSIIKNQIASTKGKTFQLDFSQPMIEDEESCKERLIKIVDALSKIDLRDYFRYPYLDKKMPVEDFKTLSNRGGEYGYERGSVERQDYMKYVMMNRIMKPFDNIDEETACYILEKLKRLKPGSFPFVYKQGEEYYSMHIMITTQGVPEPFKDTGGTYVLYLSIDLTDHYDHYYDDVCEIERLEQDIGKIFANA